MSGSISRIAMQELVATIRDQYQQSSKKETGRILDKFTTIAGHGRKQGIRLLSRPASGEERPTVGRRNYDKAVPEAVIVVWEACDRICGKRLETAPLNLVDSMEQHGHLEKDPELTNRLLFTNAATLDRLIQIDRIIAGTKDELNTYRAALHPVAM